MSKIELCKSARIRARLISFSLGHVLDPFRCDYEVDSEPWRAKCVKCSKAVTVRIDGDTAVIRGFPTWQKCKGRENVEVLS